MRPMPTLLMLIPMLLPQIAGASVLCEALFEPTPTAVVAGASTTEALRIADEWLDLEQQIQTISESSLRNLLENDRRRVMNEYIAKYGPTAGQELLAVIRERRKILTAKPVAKPLVTTEREILRSRFQRLENLPGITNLGPFLNDHQFLTNATGVNPGHLAIFDLRAQKIVQIFPQTQIRDFEPLAISPDGRIAYLKGQGNLATFNLQTGEVVLTPLEKHTPPGGQRVLQTKDQSTIFVLGADRQKNFIHKIRLSRTGAILDAQIVSRHAVGDGFVESPDGAYVFLQTSDSNPMVYHVATDQILDLDVFAGAQINSNFGQFSADSRQLVMVVSLGLPVFGREVVVWDLAQKQVVQRIALSNSIPPAALVSRAHLMADGDRLVVLAGANLHLQTLRVFSLKTGTVATKGLDFLERRSERIIGSSLSPDQKRLILVSEVFQMQSSANPERLLYELSLEDLSVIVHPEIPEQATFSVIKMTPDGLGLLLPSSRLGIFHWLR